MEPKKADLDVSASAAGLAIADKQIRVLCDKILPEIPHLLSVPTKTPYLPVFPHENQNTPFEQWEVMQLQYMTLISNADRGVGYAHGNWADAINAKSPGNTEAPSNTSTPNPVRDARKPAVKMSIADYKSLKSSGVKPSPRILAATPESRPRTEAGHSRNTSAASVSTPMGRVPSEGRDQRHHGAGASSKNDRHQHNNLNKADGADVPRSNATEAIYFDTPRASNGISARESLHAKDINKDPRATSRLDIQSRSPMKHPLPPRPQSPQRNHQEPRSQKRSFESGDASQPEKRSKADHTDSRTPPIPQKASNRKAEATSTKVSPSKVEKPAQSTPSHAPSQPTKSSTPRTKPVETKGHSSKSSTSEKPLNLPPLLSPLPADLETPPQPNFESLKRSEATRHPETPSQNSQGSGADTIVVKQPHAKGDLTSSSPLSSAPNDSPPFVLPRLLSPDLPDIVEAELLRLQRKAVASAASSVEARHEKARQPGALGVAQKRPKVGHPPKKSHGESGSAKKTTPARKAPEKTRLIVKMPYKRADAKRIKDLLRLRANPWNEFKRLESKLLGSERAPAVVPSKDDSESEEDIPLTTIRATKTPIPNQGKKRPVDSSDHNGPAPKRSKGLENIDVGKASTPLAPPFRSPALNGSGVKDSTLLATPKKGDAMKSVAMRRVDSADANARTPQPTNTPVSAEKPRVRLEKAIDQEQLSRARADESKFYPLGTTLKRKAQAIVTKKGVTEDEKKVGVMRGVESLMAYMIAFHSRDKIEIMCSRPLQADSWEQFFSVWSFVETNTKQYPELRTLIDQLGAVSREQLMKVYTNLPEESRKWDSFLACLKHRDSLWTQCKKHHQLLSDLGIEGTLGPWSTVSEAVGFGVATLSCYAVAQKMEWEGDSHFSTAFTKQFMQHRT